MNALGNFRKTKARAQPNALAVFKRGPGGAADNPDDWIDPDAVPSRTQKAVPPHRNVFDQFDPNPPPKGFVVEGAKPGGMSDAEVGLPDAPWVKRKELRDRDVGLPDAPWAKYG